MQTNFKHWKRIYTARWHVKLNTRNKSMYTVNKLCSNLVSNVFWSDIVTCWTTSEEQRKVWAGVYTNIHCIATYHYTPANDAIFSSQGDLAIYNIDSGYSICSSFNVTQVPSMSVAISRPTMLLSRGVEVTPGTHTSSTVVTKHMDVESMSTWLQSRHFTSHSGSTTLKEKYCIQ